MMLLLCPYCHQHYSFIDVQAIAKVSSILKVDADSITHVRLLQIRLLPAYTLVILIRLIHIKTMTNINDIICFQATAEVSPIIEANTDIQTEFRLLLTVRALPVWTLQMLGLLINKKTVTCLNRITGIQATTRFL